MKTIYDLIVYGATSGGIISAVQAVKEGLSVLVLEPSEHIGGMTTGGLSWVDGGELETIGGLSKAFFEEVCVGSGEPPEGFSSGWNPWTLTPSVALAAFERLISEFEIPVLTGQRLKEDVPSVGKVGSRVSELRMESGELFRGRMFIDATYEGDLMAAAGVSYRIGRESRDEFGESKAGVLGPSERQPQQFDVFIDPYRVPGDPESGLLRYIQEGPLAPEGSGDDKTQAYCYRVCLTRDSDIVKRVEISEPAGYDQERYEILRRYLAARAAAGLETRLEEDLLKISHLPDLKTDINNRGPLSLDHIGESWSYPEGSYAERERVIREHTEYTQGLFWFLKSDPSVPPHIREAMAAFAYPADEYEKNGHWSPQLYVRVARRMLGEKFMTQHDIPGTSEASIGMGSYGVDSHHVQRLIFPADYGPDTHGAWERDSSGKLQLEGNFLEKKCAYEIPYGAICPKREQCENLLVTFCVSASHVAFSSLRMEPIFMLLGQSAASAVAQALREEVEVQAIDMMRLREKLRADGQALSLDTCEMERG
jgi:hypothetical protein